MAKKKYKKKHEADGTGLHWKKLFNSESKEAWWEIIHDSEIKSVRLIHFPNNEDDAPHIDIEMDYKKFEDLCDFINRISHGKK